MITNVEIRHYHGFFGLGGGARGFNQGEARVGSMQAKFRCIGGFDVDPAAVRDFERLVGVPGTVLDAFSRDQHLAFHGKEPPRGWREATPEDSDWRSLNRLELVDGHLRDYLIVPKMHHGTLGMIPWSKSMGTVTGSFSVADPRFENRGNDYSQYGVWPNRLRTLTCCCFAIWRLALPPSWQRATRPAWSSRRPTRHMR